jgi:cytidine deaminase
MIDVAIETRKNAFSHRSMHKIWASVLTLDGQIFWWCNIESVISWLGTCAERCAIDHAVAHGHYDIIAICTIDSDFTPTCWACLQYAMLFSQLTNQQIILINWDVDWNYEIKTLVECLPEWYKTQSNLERIKWYSKKKKD